MLSDNFHGLVQEILHDMCISHVIATSGAIERLEKLLETPPANGDIQATYEILNRLKSLKKSESTYCLVLTGCIDDRYVVELLQDILKK